MAGEDGWSRYEYARHSQRNRSLSRVLILSVRFATDRRGAGGKSDDSVMMCRGVIIATQVGGSLVHSDEPAELLHRETTMEREKNSTVDVGFALAVTRYLGHYLLERTYQRPPARGDLDLIHHERCASIQHTCCRARRNTGRQITHKSLVRSSLARIHLSTLSRFLGLNPTLNGLGSVVSAVGILLHSIASRTGQSR